MKARPAVSVLASLAILAIAPPVRAQDEPAGSIRLLSQSPWTTPTDPILRIEVRVRNDGATTLESPEVGWTLGDKIGARDEYEAALIEGPEFPRAANTVTIDAPLEPRAAQNVPLEIDTAQYPAFEPTESGVYPLELELRSESVSIAAVTTAAIHITQTPQKRVAFSWWTELEVPVAFAPDGTMIDEGFEAALAAGGSIAAQVAAIADVLETADRGPDDGEAPAVDLVVSPSALDQLEQAADGYRRSDGTQVTETDPAAVAAASTLKRLRDLAGNPDVRLHATPFAAPRLPSLLSSPFLSEHLDDQWRLGDATFERILGEPPDARVARPPGLALDAAAIDELGDRNTQTILGAADSVERPTDVLDLTPPPAARLTTAVGTQVDIVLPDPSTQALLLDRDLVTTDPVRAAQVVLGELATIWRELPVPPDPDVRGLAIDVPHDLARRRRVRLDDPGARRRRRPAGARDPLRRGLPVHRGRALRAEVDRRRECRDRSALRGARPGHLPAADLHVGEGADPAPDGRPGRSCRPGTGRAAVHPRRLPRDRHTHRPARSGEPGRDVRGRGEGRRAEPDRHPRLLPVRC